MLALPFWLRMWQCLHKWYFQDSQLQLANAAKYISKLIPTIVLVLGGSTLPLWSQMSSDEGDNKWGLREDQSGFYAYVITQTIATSFCLYWDIRWDWGLCIGKEPGN